MAAKTVLSAHPRRIAIGGGGAAVDGVERRLAAAGFRWEYFRPDGEGGRDMETRIALEQFSGVLELAMGELADEMVGGVGGAGPNRLTAAALAGIPQVISLGGLDRVTFGPRSTIPVIFADRKFHVCNESATLMRTTPEENDRLGREIALKACAARGPTAILLPLRGLSGLDREGGPFYWPEANAALFQSLRNWLAPNVELVKLDLHVDDREFGELAAAKLLEMMGEKFPG